MTGRAIVLRGDAAHLPLPDESVDLIVTSPPYFGQRAYIDGGEVYDGQIGNEETPREYLANLLECTREWMRVLKPGGSIFVNLGDKYSQRVATRPSSHQDGLFPDRPELRKDWKRDRAAGLARMPYQNVISEAGDYVAEKSLMQLPQRYSIACTDHLGLILRQDNIWYKTSGMPESVEDRCATRHEYVFHFTVQPRYFSAIDEIREAHQPQSIARSKRNRFTPDRSQPPWGSPHTADPAQSVNALGKLPGSVWPIATAPLNVPERIEHARCCGGRKRPGCEDGIRHNAAFPPALAAKAILGWSPSGICVGCGEGRRPVPLSVGLDMSRPQARRAQQLAERAGLTEDHLAALLSVGVSDTGRGAATQSGTGKNTPEVYALAAEARAALGGYAREYLLRRPTRFTYACACPSPGAPTRPAVVLDPFSGTGTTMLTASVLGRIGVGVDRSMDYCRLATWRCSDPGERARALGVPKPPPVPEGQGSLFDGLESA